MYTSETQSLSLNKLLLLKPPLKKGDIGGFALARFGKIPPTPLYKGGNIIYGQALNPSCPPFTKGRNSPVWGRGIRGDFGKMCLAN